MSVSPTKHVDKNWAAPLGFVGNVGFALHLVLFRATTGCQTCLTLAHVCVYIYVYAFYICAFEATPFKVDLKAINSTAHQVTQERLF